jgi:hypothetical protein
MFSMSPWTRFINIIFCVRVFVFFRFFLYDRRRIYIYKVINARKYYTIQRRCNTKKTENKETDLL